MRVRPATRAFSSQSTWALQSDEAGVRLNCSKEGVGVDSLGLGRKHAHVGSMEGSAPFPVRLEGRREAICPQC